MSRKILDRELDMLDKQLTEMGGLCMEGISLAVISLVDKDRREELNGEIHDIERETDRKEVEIEQLCTKIILQQQPIAGDFQLIKAAVHMIADMERIGDQIADIADLSCELKDKIGPGQTHIEDMGLRVKTMVKESIIAYVERDKELAQKVIKMDDIVDDHFENLRRELLALLTRDVSKGEDVLDELIIGKYFERIADHAVNICEAVVKACR